MSAAWPGSGALCPVITRDRPRSPSLISHTREKESWTKINKSSQFVVRHLVCHWLGARHLPSGLGMNCLVSRYLSEVWCYKVHFALNLNGSHNTLPHWGWGMWTRLPSNRRRVEAGARQRASPASYSPPPSPPHTRIAASRADTGCWRLRSPPHLGLLLANVPAHHSPYPLSSGKITLSFKNIMN